jgi:predicted membrane channel-forming protein YqfA (hemolysin III family)
LFCATPSKSVFFNGEKYHFEVSMNKLIVLTYVLRGLGFVLVILSLFGHGILLNLFPGLEGTSINPFFYSGLAVYLVGAIIYFFVNKKIRADKRRREIEETESRIFGKKDDQE